MTFLGDHRRAPHRLLLDALSAPMRRPFRVWLYDETWTLRRYLAGWLGKRRP